MAAVAKDICWGNSPSIFSTPAQEPNSEKNIPAIQENFGKFFLIKKIGAIRQQKKITDSWNPTHEK